MYMSLISQLPLSESLDIAQNFRRMLGQYFSGRYEILSGLQIHKFNQTRSIEWDPQGQQRLVAHCVLDDIYVTPPGGGKVLAKARSMFVS
jgi:hypothetical protein